MIGCHVRRRDSVHEPLLIAGKLHVLKSGEKSWVKLLVLSSWIAGRWWHQGVIVGDHMLRTLGRVEDRGDGPRRQHSKHANGAAMAGLEPTAPVGRELGDLSMV